MKYFVERTRRSMALKRQSLVLVVIPPLLYLAFLALIPDHYRLSQSVPAGPATTLTQPLAPKGGATVSDLLARPELLFENQFGLMELNRHLYKVMHVAQGENVINAIRGYVQGHMSLEVASDDAVEIVYTGEELQTGRILVNFFARRLRSRIGAPAPKAPAVVKEEVFRILWHPSRVIPALWILVLSLFLLLVFLVVLEWMDPSLKTVRQTARYLDLPVLGMMPDLQKLNDVLTVRPPPAERETP